MRLVRSLGVLVVVLAMACVAQAAGKGKGKGAKKAHAVRGVVTAVQKDKDKDEGTFTAKVGGKKAKDGQPAVEPTEKTFKVTAETKVERVVKAAKKGEKPETEPATFADVHEGDRVAVTAKGDTAETVKILPKGKKNK
jgi:hypothetical protein